MSTRIMDSDAEARKWRVVERVPVGVASGDKEEPLSSFRLIYEGPLLSNQSGDRKAVANNKHGIRKQLHKQLRELWKSHGMLQTIARVPIQFFKGEAPLSDKPGIESLAANYSRGGYGFVPLVCSDFQLVCSLDIMFLRREAPGALVQGGDLDNRLKTLFDGLRLPEAGELPEPLEEDEKPFYCLLQDDRLITEVKVTTDRLLRPMQDGASRHDASNVVLILGVDINQTLRLW